jgi:hypothetical protein
MQDPWELLDEMNFKKGSLAEERRPSLWSQVYAENGQGKRREFSCLSKKLF